VGIHGLDYNLQIPCGVFRHWGIRAEIQDPLICCDGGRIEVIFLFQPPKGIGCLG
jgi:hypothetical protein